MWGPRAVRGFLREGVQVIAVVRPEDPKKLDKLPINDNILSDRMDVVELDLSGLSRLPEMVLKADIFLHFGWGGSGSEARKDAALQNANARVCP